MWGVHLLVIPRSLRWSIYSNFNYLFYGLSDSGVILKELGHNLRSSVKSEGKTPLYTWEKYKNIKVCYASSFLGYVYFLLIKKIVKN